MKSLFLYFLSLCVCCVLFFFFLPLPLPLNLWPDKREKKSSMSACVIVIQCDPCVRWVYFLIFCTCVWLQNEGYSYSNFFQNGSWGLFVYADQWGMWRKTSHTIKKWKPRKKRSQPDFLLWLWVCCWVVVLKQKTTPSSYLPLVYYHILGALWSHSGHSHRSSFLHACVPLYSASQLRRESALLDICSFCVSQSSRNGHPPKHLLFFCVHGAPISHSVHTRTQHVA